MVPRPAGYVYRTDNVMLSLGPRRGMTWGMWGDTVRGLRLFGEVWEFVALDFDVWEKEGAGAGVVRCVALGRLAWVE